MPTKPRIEAELLQQKDVPYEKAAAQEIIWRWGTEHEEIEHLSDRAAQAYDVIGIYGVTTFAGKPPASAKVSYAKVEDLTAGGFNVYITPWKADPQHRTVELPNPLTQQSVDDWNKIWNRT